MTATVSTQPAIANNVLVKQEKKSNPIWFGGAAASMAATMTHPLDQAKYRLQVMTSRASLFQTIRAFAMRDGVLSLWNGLSASILRQSTYSTARFALFDAFTDRLSKAWPTSDGKPSQLTTVVSAGLAGGIAGMIGNPAEIILVRMCADAAVESAAARFNYSNAIAGLVRMAREDGLSSYLRGFSPNLLRAVLMNVSQLGTYTEAKRWMLATKSMDLKDDTWTHTLASLTAGTVATTVCAPADVLKSRFQNASGSAKTSMLRYVTQTSRKEGLGFLFRGWVPAWLRIAPQTVLTFVFLEKLKEIFVTGRKL